MISLVVINSVLSFFQNVSWVESLFEEYQFLKIFIVTSLAFAAPLRYSQPSLSRLRLSRITAYLEEKI